MRLSYTVRLALLPGLIAAACLCWAATKPKALSSYDPQAKALLARMTLDEKIGQMTQPEQNELKDPADVENYFVGSVFSGGSSDPKEGNSLEAWTDLYDRLQARTKNTRLKIPILYGIDALHGHNNVLNAVIFPQNIGLGCTRNPQLIEKVGRITAEEVRATGIQWTFAPCVTVPQDIRWGRTYEGFSEDPKLVRELAGPAVRGLQGVGLDDPLGVLACAKHFIGDGGTAYGSTRSGLDQGDTRVDEATLRRIHLPGYLAAIEQGVGSIMPSYSSWNGVKCSASKRLLTDILKNELGFQGFLISDYNAIDQIAKDYKEAIAISINAGMDMVMVPTRYREYFNDLKALVNEDKVPMSRIDDAVMRILRVKFAMGLMDPNRSQLADRSLQKSFGSPEHRAVARQAVRESLVLLKNDAKLLPLSKRAPRIHVGRQERRRYRQSMRRLDHRLAGQERQRHHRRHHHSDRHQEHRVGGHQSDVLQGRHGRRGSHGRHRGGRRDPYAEMMGDRANLNLAPEDVAAVKNMKAAGIPVVVVVVSGRPLILGDVATQAGALVAAWLPGTEGQGVADVLFGDYKPTGKLSFTWPKAVGQGTRDPLYAYGYGLKY